MQGLSISKLATSCHKYLPDGDYCLLSFKSLVTTMQIISTKNAPGSLNMFFLRCLASLSAASFS